MSYKLIIKGNENGHNILVYEDDKIVEQYQEKVKYMRKEGNIYLGKVKDIVKGMQSAFVDIGTEKNALIHLKDIVPKESNVTGNNNLDNINYEINDYIKQNEEILVQIKKDASNDKGARVTKDIKLVGQYAIVMPFARFITLSTKIEDENERKRLKDLIERICNNKKINFGIIVRTSAQNANEEKIENDINGLIEIWNRILKDRQNIVAPKLLYNTNGMIGKLIDDFLPSGLEIITNNEFMKQKIKKYNSSVSVRIKEDIIPQIKNERKIWLKCGGFITIDRTEALIAIDVNSGKCTGKKGQEETVYKVNEEAAKEISKQLRLQDLGGIIIIDFINMHNEENRERIIKILNEELKHDRSKVQIIEFTKLGLLEITRKSIYKRTEL